MKNRGSLLKGTAGKIVSPERGLINFLGPLLKIGLSLMKYLPMPLAKSVLITLGLTAAASAIDAAIQKKKKKKNMDQQNLKWRNERCPGNSYTSYRIRVIGKMGQWND